MATAGENLGHAICLSVNVQKSGLATFSSVVNNRITKFPEKNTFACYFHQIIEKLQLQLFL